MRKRRWQLFFTLISLRIFHSTLDHDIISRHFESIGAFKSVVVVFFDWYKKECIKNPLMNSWKFYPLMEIKVP
ncbi:MAG: hypothetical protein J7604_21510 [Sporocytophaga sp.]|uniref:hypothetical protein n=1 Tax=Sporocytophaga sp. TaxID=2231183 RepID=UPI001AFF0E35|nr:hypothetical protein [Sporocytophaga sp.]MBO9702805.1 hypothetical protein [Sporocytophaga sp.]